MERLISDEERIRRAEDVLERRKNTDLRISSESFLKEKTNFKIKKMLIQILICLIIYCTFFHIKNSDNKKLQSFVGEVKGILSYDIDFPRIYGEICEKIRSFNNLFGDGESEDNQKENQYIDKQDNVLNKENTQENNEKNDIGYTNEILGIGGEVEEVKGNDKLEKGTEEEQMKADANYIMTNYRLAKPVNIYTVTSEFGERQSSEIVSSNHRGIDLGARAGTEIYASLDGNVVEASEIGDFGKHLKIQTDNIVIIYAHCSKLMVKQGDIITKGQKIAEVGSTGKATGPHLHFEVRVDSRAVNPRLIMEF